MFQVDNKVGVELEGLLMSISILDSAKTNMVRNILKILFYNCEK